MKRTLLLKGLLSMIFLFMGMCVWAESVTFTAGNNTSTSTSLEVGGVKITISGGKLDGTQYRIYKNQTITITPPSGNITKVVFTCTASGEDQYGPGCFAATDGYSYADKVGTWKGEAETLTMTAESNQVRCTSIEVTYTPDASVLLTTVSFGDDAQSKYYAKLDESFTSPVASVKASDGTSLSGITYSSSKKDVATVNESTGEVTLVSAGSTIITASYAATTGYAASSASYTLNVYNTYTTMQELQAATAEYSGPIKYTFKDIYVTGVKNNNAYISDGTYGAIIFTSGHGLVVGNVINGSAFANLTLYNGATEITDFSKDGLTITTTELTPQTVSVADLTKANVGRYVTLEGVTYGSTNTTFTQNGNTIVYYNGLSFTGTLEDGKTYNVTGVIAYATSKGVEIMPLSVEEVESGKTKPTLSATYKEELTVGETDSYEVTYDGDGELSVSSSDPDVVAIAYSDKSVIINAIAAGSTTITITVPETDKYEGAKIEYTLTVNEEGEETVEWIASVLGTETISHSEGWETEFNDDISAYWDAPEKATKPGYNKDGTARLYMGGGYVKISAAEGYAISAITITCSSSTYVGYNVSANVGTYETSGSVGSWSGLSPNVTITNNATRDNNVQMRIKSIKVSYVELTEITGKTVEISSIGKATFTPDRNCIIGDGSISKYITGVEENGWTLIEEDAPVVKAGEGVLLTGEAGTYKLYTHASLTATANTNNKLVGANETTYAPEGTYILQKKKGETDPKFYHVATDGKFDVNGHAYLDLGTAASGVKVLNFAGDAATAIQQVDAAEMAEGRTYNLQGVQVNDSYKGIIIRGGKKYLKK